MKRKTKPFSAKPLLLGLGIGVVVIGGLWIPVIRPAYQRHTAAHDVAQLLEALQGYQKIEGDYPTGDAPTICRLLRGETVDGQNARRLDYVEGYKTDEKGEFLDPWGSPYRFSFEPKLRIASAGPNKLDENGGGDDIVAQ